MPSTSLSLRLAKLAAVALLPVASAVFAQNAAVVNSKPITTQKVDDFVAMLVAQGQPDTPELRAAVREELIARELFTQEAERKGLPRNTEVQNQLAVVRQDILIRALIRDYLKENPISDAELASAYESFKKDNSAQEYRARHILVETEDEAKKLLAELKNGAAFETLAKASKDPGSGQQGGDLGWNTADTFVKEFSDAMVALEKGKLAEAPVQSQFGWHVIRLDDVREAEAPPLEQVGPQLRQQIERQRLQSLQQSLRAKAKIE